MKNWLIKKPINALLYSLSGVKTAIATERAFQQEAIVLVILLIVIPISSRVDLLTGAFLILSWTLVMVVELLNSAIEACFDRVSMDDHALTKIGKDLGSAAVFLTILFNIGLWLAVGIKYFH